ncbi:MAG: efflux RND transporter periplasmic adaptor subunit [Isosphaeraceae bacterium]
MTETAQAGGGRRIARRIGMLVLALAFTAGIVALMLMLSGRFEAKVPGPSTGAGTATAPASTPAGSRPAGDRPTVEVRLVRQPRRETAVGTIRAVAEAIVASKILARVEDVKVTAGQVVKQGDVLIRLDDADLRARLEQAKAAVAAAQARFEQAELDLTRARNLRAREAVTQGELDRASTAWRTAKADLEGARRAEDEAKILEAYATIRAPISGRIVDKRVNVGDTVNPGQPLVTMYDPSHMQLIATVRESLALRLKVGQSVPARLDTIDYDCLATIREIVPEAQAESRSFQVKVTGPCPPGVYSGMFGRIFIPLDDEEVLVVPDAAVRRVGQLEEVDVVVDGRLDRRVVQLGRESDEGREVLSGLKAGERVALDRPAKPGRGGSRQ